ncbi:MAG: hypothetical protein M3N95_16635 [Actinomycetota bacterium]|nr:hypothetical protein [Actinomycetota bacterium]
MDQTSGKSLHATTVIGWSLVGLCAFAWLLASLALSNISRGEALAMIAGYVATPPLLYWAAGRAPRAFRIPARALVATLSTVLLLALLAASVA